MFEPVTPSAFSPLLAGMQALHAVATAPEPWPDLLGMIRTVLRAHACQLALELPGRAPLVLRDALEAAGPLADLRRLRQTTGGSTRVLQPEPGILCVRLRSECGEGLLALQRGPGAPAFTGHERHLLAALAAQLQAALDLRARCESQWLAARQAADLFQQIPSACIVTDRVGRCLQATEAFTAQVGRGSLRLATGRVRFDDDLAQQMWETALLETHATGVGREFRITCSLHEAWLVRLKPWQGELPDAGPHHRFMLACFEAVATAAAPAPHDPVSLSGASRLTQAELDVLASLMKGMPAKTIAGLRGASVNTVRNQIMTILGKTGFRSQKELIASYGASGFDPSSIQTWLRS